MVDVVFLQGFFLPPAQLTESQSREIDKGSSGFRINIEKDCRLRLCQGAAYRGLNSQLDDEL